MADLPAVRAPALPTFDIRSPIRSTVRALEALDGYAFSWVQRAALTLRPQDFRAGADFATDHAYNARFDVEQGMSALSEFAWVYAPAMAIASDLQRLPLRVSIGRGRKAKILDDHPVMRLLEKPSPRTRASFFRRQKLIDLVLTGSRYTLKVYPSTRKGPPSSLLRLHPIRTKPIPLPNGELAGVEYQGGGSAAQRFDFSALMHVELPSWEDDPSALGGMGLIRPLRRELNTDLAIQRNLERSAKKGKPDGIISPGGNDEATGWNGPQTAEMRAYIERLFANSAGGMAVLGRKLDVQKLGWSPTDIGALEQRGFIRATIGAVMGVPPVRLGLETANFATADKQLEMYWGDTLQALAASEDEDWTELAREFPNSEDVYVWHDFSGVPALQASMTSALSRVSVHILNGMNEEDAYDYEGLSDAPIGSKAPKRAAPTEPDTPASLGPSPVPTSAPGALAPAQVAQLLEIVALVAAGSLSPDAAKVLILAGAPTLTAEDADRLVAGATQLAPPPTAEAPRADEPPDDDQADDETEEEAPPIPEAERAAAWRRVARAWLDAELRDIGARTIPDDWLSPPRPAADADWLNPPKVRAAAPVAPVFTAEERAQRDARWKAWVDKVHARAENRARRAVRKFLREQHERILARVPTERKDGGLWVQRNIVDELVAILFPEGYEDDALSKAMRDIVRRAILDGFASTVDAVAEPLQFNPTRVDSRTDALLGELVKNVHETTKKAIREAVLTSREQGETTNELQARLQSLADGGLAFGPARALRIARTETGRSIEAGNQLAYVDYEAAGIELEKEWLSARDIHVRPEHVALDGVAVPVQGEFAITVAGVKVDAAPHPGAFTKARHNVNCRCTTIPRRVKK